MSLSLPYCVNTNLYVIAFLDDESSSLVPVFVVVVVVVVLPPFQLFCSMTAAISLLLSVVYQRVIVKSRDVCF